MTTQPEMSHSPNGTPKKRTTGSISVSAEFYGYLTEVSRDRKVYISDLVTRGVEWGMENPSEIEVNQETYSALHRARRVTGHSIGEVLDMAIVDALERDREVTAFLGATIVNATRQT